MKFTYCPRCKELRTKPWYAIRDRCARCGGDVTLIPIPPGKLTYLMYGIMGLSLLMVYLGTSRDDRAFVYVALGCIVAMFIVQAKELARGERYSKSRIKPTESDFSELARRGWFKHK